MNRMISILLLKILNYLTLLFIVINYIFRNPNLDKLNNYLFSI